MFHRLITTLYFHQAVVVNVLSLYSCYLVVNLLSLIGMYIQGLINFFWVLLLNILGEMSCTVSNFQNILLALHLCFEFYAIFRVYQFQWCGIAIIQSLACLFFHLLLNRIFYRTKSWILMRPNFNSFFKDCAFGVKFRSLA